MSTVVILLSDKRSGSTMIQDELCRHSSIHHVVDSPHTYFETHHWLKSAVVLKRPASLFAGARIYEGYGSRENARSYILETLQMNISDYQPPESDESLVFDGWEALCRHFAKPVFFEKSPQILSQWSAINLLLEWLAQTELDVKIIGLVRNPMAVQFSAQELFSTAPERRQFAWLEAHKNLLALKSMLPPDQFELIRYEDVIAEPVKVLGNLCKFIGVACEPQVGADVHAKSVEKWRSDPNYTLQLDPAVRQLAAVFGYTAEELSNPNRPAQIHAISKRPSIKRRFGLWLVRRRDRFFRPLLIRLRHMFARGR